MVLKINDCGWGVTKPEVMMIWSGRLTTDGMGVKVMIGIRLLCIGPY